MKTKTSGRTGGTASHLTSSSSNLSKRKLRLGSTPSTPSRPKSSTRKTSGLKSYRKPTTPNCSSRSRMQLKQMHSSIKARSTSLKFSTRTVSSKQAIISYCRSTMGPRQRMGPCPSCAQSRTKWPSSETHSQANHSLTKMHSRSSAKNTSKRLQVLNDML